MAKKSTKSPEAARECGFCAYIGPSIVGVIQTGKIFAAPRSEVLASPDLADALQRFPQIRRLIVSGDVLAISRVQVKTPGNLLYDSARQILKNKKS